MIDDPQTAADHLVGNLYFNLGAVPLLAGKLHPDDLPETPAKTVYREMCRLHITPDRHLSAGSLESALRAVDFDFGYITGLQSRIVFESVEALEEYADTINAWADDREAERKLVGALASIQQGAKAQEILPSLMQALAATSRTARNRGRYIADIMADLANDIAEWQAGGQEEGYSTGFADLDRIVRLVPGELTLVAARPSMGKTSLAMQIAENVARRYSDGQVVVFSAEMTEKSLSLRMAGSLAGVNAHRIRTRTADPDEYHRILDATRQFDNVPIYIDDESSITTEQMYYRTAMLHAQKPVKLMLFDFVELGGDKTDKRSDGEEQRISHIARGLKAIAKNLNIPVMALSQLSRDVEKRADKLPILSDLRYSGMLEQVSDVVVFLMRPEYYLKRDQTCYLETHLHNKGVCYAIVAKHRNGPVGRVNLSFVEKYTRFGDLAKVGIQPEYEDETE